VQLLEYLYNIESVVTYDLSVDVVFFSLS